MRAAQPNILETMQDKHLLGTKAAKQTNMFGKHVISGVRFTKYMWHSHEFIYRYLVITLSAALTERKKDQSVGIIYSNFNQIFNRLISHTENIEKVCRKHTEPLTEPFVVDRYGVPSQFWTRLLRCRVSNFSAACLWLWMCLSFQRRCCKRWTTQ